MLLGSNYDKHVIPAEVKGIRESVSLLLTVYRKKVALTCPGG